MKKFWPLLFVLLPLSITYRSSGQPSAVGLRAMLANSRTDSARLDALDLLSKHYSYVDEDSAIYFSKKGLELARSTHNKQVEAEFLHRAGAIYEKHNELHLAQRYATEAMELSKRTGYAYGQAISNSLLGVIEGKKGNFRKANEYFLLALKMYELANNRPGIVQALIKLGHVNEETGNLDKALQYYTKAKRLNENQPVSNATFTLMNSIGVIYARKGDMMTALQLFKEGVEQSNSPRNAGVHITLLGNLGNAYEALGRISDAKEVQLEVMKKARAFSLPEQEARAMINISSLMMSSQPKETIRYLEAAKAIADTIESKQILIDAGIMLAQAYELTGDYKKAFKEVDEYARRKDSLHNQEKNREIAAMQADYELEQSQIQVQSLKLLNQKRTLERNIVIVAAISFLTLMVFFGLYYRHTRALNRKLEELNKVKNRLFSIIGHDLRGPLTSAVQTLELMGAGMLNEEETAMITGELRSHSEATLDTLNSLLVWGKSQLDGAQVANVVFDVGPEVVRTIQALHRQAAYKGITISNWTAGHKIKADIDHFNFVVRNLLSNAIKFSHPESHIHITASADTVPGMVVFSVKDAGVGINDAEIAQIFNEERGIGVGTSGEKGTGLGLMLCKDFVEANGGDIWVISKAGEGSTFSFSMRKE